MLNSVACQFSLATYNLTEIDLFYFYFTDVN